jgi:hypothetical protein
MMTYSNAELKSIRTYLPQVSAIRIQMIILYYGDITVLQKKLYMNTVSSIFHDAAKNRSVAPIIQGEEEDVGSSWL